MSTRTNFGWSYPAGAEFDPNAPWNEPHEPPELEAPVVYEHEDCPACGSIARWKLYWRVGHKGPIEGWHCSNCGWKQEAIPEDFPDLGEDE